MPVSVAVAGGGRCDGRGGRRHLSGGSSRGGSGSSSVIALAERAQRRARDSGDGELGNGASGGLRGRQQRTAQ
jgi:hypothetical protein